MSARARRFSNLRARVVGRRFLRVLAQESGQSLIEALTAFVVLLIASTGLAQILISSTSARGYALQSTRAEEVAQTAIEQIRNLPYQDVGTVDGNPSGTWSASQLADSSQLGFSGFGATVSTSINYVADPVPDSYIELTNYKQVTVTVTLNSHQLAQDITYIAPPTQTLQGNQSQGSITVTVLDPNLPSNNGDVSGATVSLGTGPSAPESGTTAATGQVVFAGLTPNPGTGSESTYTLSPLPVLPAGYEPAAGNTTSTVLTAGGASSLTYNVFQPSTIDVDPTLNGAAYVGTLQVTVTPQTGTAQTYSVTCTSSGCTPITGNASLGVYISPGDYTLTATGTSGTTNVITASGVTEVVPSNYPTTLSQTFTLPLLTVPTLTVSAPSTLNAGSTIAASAIGSVLGGALSPTGTVSWKVFGPLGTAPTSCTSGGTALGTPVTVSADATYNPTAGFTPTSIGDYWWYASYSGDSNNSAETSTCGSGMTETVVAKASPSLVLTAPPTDNVGTPVTASSVSATLSGGGAATGTVSFKVFGPQASAPTTCTTGGTAVGSGTAVSGNASYNPTASYTPSSLGDYWWYASYSGDGNDNSAATTCGSAMAETVVGKNSPTLAVAGPATATTGTTVASSSISATLTGAYNSTGTVTFVVFGPQASAPTTCTSGGTTVGTDGSSPYNPSSSWTPSAPGDYWWYASYGGDSNNNAAAATCGSGMSETVVAKASPTLAAGAPASGTVGTAIAATSITATLSGGSSATGAVTFTVFGPQASAPTTCTSGGTALGSDSTSPYSSPVSYTPSTAGDYWWYASYAGDTNNNAAASTCGSGMTETVVPKFSPALTATGPASGTIGTAIATTAISSALSAGTAPTGTLSWTVFGPQTTAPTTCTSGGTSVGSGTTVSGNATYHPSAGFTPSSAGDYWWYASYTGDTNNNTAASTCGSGMSETNVPKLTTTLTATAPGSGTVGTAIAGSSITATLSGGSSPTGTVTFTVFGPQASAPTTCTSGGTALGSGTAVSGDGAYNPTVGFNPPSAGNYWWYASYGGDSSNTASASTCGTGMSETVVAKASPALTAAGPGTGAVGTAITASSVSATLSGAAAATGTVSFKVFGPQASAPTTCTTGGTAVGSGTTVSGNATYNPTTTYTPSSPGDYWWYASYGGDSNNNAAAATCGSGMSETVVAKASPTLAAGAPASGTVGTAIAATSITATLSGGSSATGAVTFTVFGPQASAPTTCTSGGTALGSDSTSPYTSPVSYTPPTAGDYWWYASYAGDTNNNAAASTCGSGMTETVVPKFSPALTATGPASGTIGTAIATTAISSALSAGTAPTGTLSWTVFGPQTTAPTTCTSGGTSVGSGTTVSGNATYHPSAGFTPSSAGDYWWYASYTGDTNNNTAASTCGSGMSETNVPKLTTTLTATAPGSGTVGTAIAGSSITATLSGGSSPTGAVTFTVFGPQASAPTTCTSGGTALGSDSTSPYSSPVSYTPPTAGNYWWYASYAGDTNNNASASTCGTGMSETVVPKFTTTLTTTAPTSGTAGTAIAATSITATLSGGTSPTGAVTFTVFGPQASAPTTCTSGGTALGSDSTSPYSSPVSYTPPVAGNYWWYASYAGDANNIASASTCGSGMAEMVVPMTATSLGTGTQTGGTTVATSSISTTGYPTGTTALVLVSFEAGTAKTCSSASNVGSGTALTSGIPTSIIASTSYKNSGGTDYQMCAFWAQTNDGSGSVQVTFSASVSEASIQVVEITGDDTSSPIGKTGTNSGTSAAPSFKVATGITAGSSEILFGADESGTATPATWSTPSGFTQVSTLPLNNTTTSENLAVYFGPTATTTAGALSASATWGTFGIELLP